MREGYDKEQLKSLSAQINELVDYLSNSRNQLTLNKAMDFPILRSLLTYHVTNYRWLGTLLAIVVPVGGVLYVVGTRHQAGLKRELATTIHVCDEITQILNDEAAAATAATEVQEINNN